MNGRHVACLVLLLLAVAGIRHAAAQNDAFQQAACQDEFTKLRAELEKRGMALKNAQKGSPARCLQVASQLHRRGSANVEIPHR